MFHIRYYRCLTCKKEFTLPDGVTCLPSEGVTCPHCGSDKTKEKILKRF